MLIIVSGASGVGKSTLCDALRSQRDHVDLSISYTTRAPRGAEVHGQHYHFVDRPTFDRMVEEGAFAEWAEVHGNCYGTARATVDAVLQQGRSILFDVDVQGAHQLRAAYPDETLLVMILPPSWSALEARLRGRGTDAEEVIVKRLANARAEMAQAHTFDHLIVNEGVEAAQERLIAVVDAAATRPNAVLPWLADELGIEPAS